MKLSLANKRRNVLVALVQANAFGAAFIPIVVGVLVAWELILWRIEYSPTVEWPPFGISWQGIYEFGGFPCLGVFAVMSASYFANKVSHVKFVVCLLWISAGGLFTWFAGAVFDVLPRMGKVNDRPNWQETEFLLWLIAPAWIFALGLVFSRSQTANNSTPQFKPAPTESERSQPKDER